MSRWQAQMARGDETARWSSPRAARQATAWAHAFADWLTTDQAALMRYLPEQQQALQWWKATGGGARADIAEIMPKWLAARHGLALTSLPAPPQDGLSATARHVARLCKTRSDQIRYGATYTLSPPCQAALAALVDTTRYREPDSAALSALPADGMLVLPYPLLRTGTVTGPTLADETATPAPLRAVAWFREHLPDVGDVVRVLDLSDMTGRWGRTGDASFDAQVREHLSLGHQQLPPLMFNGESLHRVGSGHSQTAARKAVMDAGLERRQQERPAWEPGTVLDDHTDLLASRFLTALADALAAPLVARHDQQVPTPGSSLHSNRPSKTTVTVFTEPGEPAH
ncbi:hypothetical protein [Dietzia sp. 179-F 9C3 NHS]|uniref:hypothetical protein n=1 Tax=Dietzia sp. 179-F 9C3 NHS TaxID=3374295 RepID=UPI00387916ED